MGVGTQSFLSQGAESHENRLKSLPYQWEKPRTVVRKSQSTFLRAGLPEELPSELGSFYRGREGLGF